MRHDPCRVNLRAMRLTLAFLVFAALAGVSGLHGWGRGYGWVLALLLWFLVASLRFGEREWRWVWRGFLWFSVAMAGLAVAQLRFMPRPHGIFSSANFLGAFAVLMCCASLYTQPLTEHYLSMAVYTAANLVSVATSQSRGALIALAGAAAVFGWKVAPRLAFVVAGCIVAAGVAITAARGWHDPRFYIWQTAFLGALQRPWLGWGQGGLGIGYSGLTSVYNVALEWFVNGGAIGLAAACWLYAEGIVAAWKLPDEIERRGALAFLAAFAVQGMFLYGGWPTYLPLVTLLAWLASEHRDEAYGAVVVEDGQPFLDGGVRPHRAD
jgi:hypothetical protein